MARRLAAPARRGKSVLGQYPQMRTRKEAQLIATLPLYQGQATEIARSAEMTDSDDWNEPTCWALHQQHADTARWQIGVSVELHVD